ncbi:MAG: rhomboid family intramembrane serine protease [Flavobacterium sp.]|jgi:membrane associated rhomboid family serine protease|uniref:rhomboid family intramembrane serine protease n=1 Tax=Flavobacterium sp. TaxID=239 RepID=UPI0022BA72F5|nr:rhomboid family intramembrane serine protease [Flavobacterium sp.]MCZ8331375.1 rhomboid family intramembrane serine protease [Flavobacterium sp.]
MENNIMLAVIVANVLVSIKGFNDEMFFRKYQFHVGSIRAGEQIRMLTSGFLHADLPHLAFNMITLYFFAPYVIYELGSLSFLLVYFGSLVFGSLLTMIFHGNEYSYRAVGASGAVTGIVYSAILLDQSIYIYGFIPGYVFGFAYLLYSIYGMKSRTDNIGHTAHFGGAIGGYVITLLKMPSLLQDNLLMVILLAVPIVILFVMAKAGKL